jgi:hypothetical protein
MIRIVCFGLCRFCLEAGFAEALLQHYPIVPWLGRIVNENKRQSGMVSAC